jgi:hypothetical protein
VHPHPVVTIGLRATATRSHASVVTSARSCCQHRREVGAGRGDRRGSQSSWKKLDLGVGDFDLCLYELDLGCGELQFVFMLLLVVEVIFVLLLIIEVSTYIMVGTSSTPSSPSPSRPPASSRLGWPSRAPLAGQRVAGCDGEPRGCRRRWWGTRSRAPTAWKMTSVGGVKDRKKLVPIGHRKVANLGF